MTKTFTAGQHIKVLGFDWNNGDVYEDATIMRVEGYMVPIPEGYWPVCFAADRARLLVHRSRIFIANIATS